jgi:hypothetical protein
VLTINFQSIKNKKPEVELIIESCCLHMIFLPTHFRSLFQGLNRYLLLWFVWMSAGLR